MGDAFGVQPVVVCALVNGKYVACFGQKARRGDKVFEHLSFGKPHIGKEIGAPQLVPSISMQVALLFIPIKGWLMVLLFGKGEQLLVLRKPTLQHGKLHDVALRMLRKGIGGGPKRVGRDSIVGIYKGQEVALGMGDTRVAGLAQSAIGLVQHRYSAVFFGPRIALLRAPIGRTIINKQHFHIVKRLFEHALYTAVECVQHVIYRYDNTYLHDVLFTKLH